MFPRLISVAIAYSGVLCILLLSNPLVSRAQGASGRSSGSIVSSSSSWQSQVNSIFGAQGETPANNILRFELVRTDLTPTLDLNPAPQITPVAESSPSGSSSTTPSVAPTSAASPTIATSSGPMPIDPAEAVFGEIAFTNHGRAFLVTVEIPLLESELGAVLVAAKQNSLNVAAIHNHLVGETPRAIFVHMEGVSTDVSALATSVLNTIQVSAAPIPGAFVSPQQGGSVNGLDSQSIASALSPNAMGEVVGNVAEIAVDRPERFTEAGVPLPAELGPQSEFHFQAMSNGQILVVAEFALPPAQVNPILTLLQQNGWQAAALHNHFLAIQPSLLFMHLVKLGDLSSEEQDIAKALNMGLSRRGH